MQSAKNASRKQISLERYMDFFDSRPRIDLTVSDLNQIIGLHGFKKVRRTPKKTMAEALEKLDLIDLSRSTIDNSSEIFPSASFALQDLVEDLNKLNWQECAVTSVQILQSSKGGRGSTEPAESCPQSTASKDAGRTLKSKADSTSPLQAADLPSTGLAESRKQSAAAARKVRTSTRLALASKSAAAAELSTGPAGSKKWKILAEISSLPAHLLTGPPAESKKKHTPAARKRSR